jgi:hypothetical protein
MKGRIYLPVRPQMPIFWPASMENVMFLRTFSDGLQKDWLAPEHISYMVTTYLYPAETLSNSMTPLDGHEGGGCSLS